jgi:opacity protein-like surface antigen
MKRLLLVGLIVAISGLPLQNARAASDVGLKGVGVDLGYVSPENLDGTLGFGAFADLGTLSPKVGLSTHLGYWSKSEGDPIVQTDVSIRDLSLTTRARYLFTVSNPKFQPYAGGGLGLHFLKATVSIPDFDLGGGFIIPGMEFSDSSTKLGVDLGGGFVSPVGKGTDLYGDMWYTMVEDFSQFSMKVGLAWRLN